jgi:hypothetical protein
MPVPMSDGRKHARKPLWIPIGIDGEKKSVGITRDASVQGVMIAAARRFQSGERVTLRLLRKDGKTELRADGKVVRVEDELGDAAQFWPWRVAVQLDVPLPELAEMIEDIELEGQA